MSDLIEAKPLRKPPTLINNNGSIALRFFYAGVRHSIALGGEYGNSQAMKFGEAVANNIYLDTHRGGFDFTLLRYKGAIDREFIRQQEIEARELKRQELIARDKALAEEAKQVKHTNSYDQRVKQVTREIEWLRKSEEQKQARENPYLLPLWDEWVNTLGLTPRAINGHYTCIRRMAEKSGNPRLIDTKWFTEYEGINEVTFNNRLGFLKTFESWINTEKGIEFRGFSKINTRSVAQKEELKPFDIYEMNAIINAFRTDQFLPKSSRFKDSFYADYVEFVFSTACRPSEAIGLRWRDLDFDQNLIVISTVLARDEKGNSSSSRRVRKERKTDKGKNRRVTPKSLLMTERLKEMLLERKASFPNAQPDHLVFPSVDSIQAKTYNLGIDDRNFRNRQWKRVLDSLGFEYRRPYSTRHTLLTQAIYSGMNAFEVADIAGHTNPEMVIKTYGHLLQKPKLPQLIQPKKTENPTKNSEQ